jgi:hypothetical protein
VTLHTGASAQVLPALLESLAAAARPRDYVVVDGGQ